jgi:hypothetical protein
VRPESPRPMGKTMRLYSSYECHHGCSRLEPGILGSVCEGVPADDEEKQLVMAVDCDLTQFASAPK